MLQHCAGGHQTYQKKEAKGLTNIIYTQSFKPIAPQLPELALEKHIRLFLTRERKLFHSKTREANR